MQKYIQEEEKRKEKEEKAKQEEEEKTKLKEPEGAAEDLALKEMTEATAREELRKAKQHDREKLCNIGRALAVLASASVCSYTISIFHLVTIHVDSNNSVAMEH